MLARADREGERERRDERRPTARSGPAPSRSSRGAVEAVAPEDEQEQQRSGTASQSVSVVPEQVPEDRLRDRGRASAARARGRGRSSSPDEVDHDERGDAHDRGAGTSRAGSAAAGTAAPSGRPRRATGGSSARLSAILRNPTRSGARSCPRTAGPCRRITTPGSGPGVPRPGRPSRPSERHPRGPRRAPGRRAARRAGCPLEVRASAPFVARKPARPGCASSLTPHHESAAVRRLNGITAAGARRRAGTASSGVGRVKTGPPPATVAPV